MIIYNAMKKLSISLIFLIILIFAPSCRSSSENLTLTDPNVPIELTDGEEFQIIVPHAGCANDIIYIGATNYGFFQITFTLAEQESKNIKTPDFEGEVEILTFSVNRSSPGTASLQLGCTVVPDPSKGITGGMNGYMHFSVNVK